MFNPFFLQNIPSIPFQLSLESMNFYSCLKTLYKNVYICNNTIKVIITKYVMRTGRKMPKVFLSHSSKDKDHYVRIVADRLISEIGIHNVIYDELTFEEGMKSFEEIEKGLSKTDLFVIFLSEDALKSSWVATELTKAYNLLSNGELKRIYPIIIDTNLSYKDTRIEDWLREEYNLKYISRPTKAVNMIKQRLLEISWDFHPRLKEKQKIFVGRNDHIKIFEERIDSFDQLIPLCFFISGLDSIGRSSLLKYCFKKTNIIEESYQPLLIYMNSHESIEDFIYKVYGLGYTDNIDLTNFLNIGMDEKINIAIKLVSDIQESKEKLFIRDDGGIVTFEGSINDWFIAIVNKLKFQDRITFGVISKFKLTMKGIWRNEKIFFIEMSELEKRERDGLLKRYLEFEQIDITLEDFKYFSNLQKGYPEQIFYTAELIKRDGIDKAKKMSHEIINYSSEKVTKLLLFYEDEPNSIDFLYLLSQFEVISYDFIFKIVGENEFYKDKLTEFMTSSLCESSGSNKEYIKVIDPVRDYIQRSGLELSAIFRKNLNAYIEEFLNHYKFEDVDIPDYLFAIKEALIQGIDIETKYLIPSHFLKTMIELYDKQRNYTEVIKVADRALDNAEFMDNNIISEIRYFLCLSLARLRNNRFIKEVQNINGADHYFLLGYFYRLTGRNDKALEEFKKSLKIRPNFSRVKRELVQVYIQLEEFETARVLAEEHYGNDKTNPYHIQAYFRCLIKAEKSTANRRVLEELLDNLSKVKSIVAEEMLLRCKAQFLAFYENKEAESVLLINRAIKEYPNLMYATFTKIEICEKFNRISDMEILLGELDKTIKRGDYNYVSYIKSKAIMLAMKKQIGKALDLIEQNKKYIPDRVIDKIIVILEFYDSHQVM
jgi:tetratricopeptide (TPR) repeat protein